MIKREFGDQAKKILQPIYRIQDTYFQNSNLRYQNLYSTLTPTFPQQKS